MDFILVIAFVWAMLPRIDCVLGLQCKITNVANAVCLECKNDLRLLSSSSLLNFLTFCGQVNKHERKSLLL